MPVRRHGRLASVLTCLAAAAALLTLTGTPSATAAPPVPQAPPTAAAVAVPPGVTAGIAVFDRQTNTFTEQLGATAPFRSASVVKILLALDHVWDRGPAYQLPAADRARLDTMLRSSDDDAANYYWERNGSGAIIDRMVSRLGLADTARPPAAYPGFWGYTALSANDTVRIYRYVLDAPAPLRELIMGNLRQSTRCASDDFDQHFGIPGSFARPWAVKQGWSGFASGGCGTAPAPAAARGVAAPAGAAAVDLARPALHTTGTVGTNDRTVVAVYTLHPEGTPYGKAYTDVNRLTRSLDVPGAVRPPGTWFTTWGTGVSVRPGAAAGGTKVTSLPPGVEVLVDCQKEGQVVNVPPYTNQWWAHLPQYGGYMTNIYLNSPGNELPGVPVC
ncbi:hypothetical protein [Streptomyces liangshanensis]|uniref:hypothetical protein n=1 Tax=Streptomyces liangshanensis TaxID=2717324 RepID=UPI0036D9D9B6